MPEVRGHAFYIYMFVDADLEGEKSTICSHTGVLILINKAPIYWYRKRQSTIEASNFGAEFCAMKTGVDMMESLRHNIRMFELPIDIYANVFCHNEAV